MGHDRFAEEAEEAQTAETIAGIQMDGEKAKLDQIKTFAQIRKEARETNAKALAALPIGGVRQ